MATATLHLNPSQTGEINRLLGSARWAYNKGIEYTAKFYEDNQSIKSPSISYLWKRFELFLNTQEFQEVEDAKGNKVKKIKPSTDYETKRQNIARACESCKIKPLVNDCKTDEQRLHFVAFCKKCEPFRVFTAVDTDYWEIELPNIVDFLQHYFQSGCKKAIFLKKSRYKKGLACNFSQLFRRKKEKKQTIIVDLYPEDDIKEITKDKFDYQVFFEAFSASA